MSDYSINATIGADDSGFQSAFSRVTNGLAEWGMDFDKLYERGADFFKGFGLDIDVLAGKLGTSGPVLAAWVTFGLVFTQVAAEIISSIDELVDEYKIFEKQISEVYTLLPDLSEDARDQISDDVDEMSKKFGVLPEELIPSLYQAISAGVPQENVFSFLETAQKAAVGGVSSLISSVNGLTSVVNAYGSDILSVEDASDSMFTAVKDGKTTFDELAASLYNVIPTAASAGVSFDEVTAALAAITAQGTPTTVATTQLRQMLVELSKDGSKTAQTFERISGQSFKQFQTQGGNVAEALELLQKEANDTGVGINDLFSSVEAGNAALQLSGRNAERYGNFLDDMANKSGATDRAFRTMNDTLYATEKRFQASIAIIRKDAGEMFAPLWKGVYEGSASIVNALDEVVKMVGQIIEPIADIFGTIFSSLMSVAGRFIEFFIDNVVNSAGWQALITILDTIRNVFVNAFESAANIINTAVGIISDIFSGDFRNAFLGAQLIVLNMVKLVLDQVSIMVNGVINLINGMAEKANIILNVFGQSIPKISEIALSETTGLNAKITAISNEMAMRHAKTTSDKIKLETDAGTTIAKVSEDTAKLQSQWADKAADAYIDSLEREKTAALKRANDQKLTLDQMLKVAEEYDQKIFESFQSTLEKQRAAELDGAEKVKADAETIANINAVYDEIITSYKEEQLKKRQKLEADYLKNHETLIVDSSKSEIGVIEYIAAQRSEAYDALTQKEAEATKKTEEESKKRKAAALDEAMTWINGFEEIASAVTQNMDQATQDAVSMVADVGENIAKLAISGGTDISAWVSLIASAVSWITDLFTAAQREADELAAKQKEQADAQRKDQEIADQRAKRIAEARELGFGRLTAAVEVYGDKLNSINAIESESRIELLATEKIWSDLSNSARVFQAQIGAIRSDVISFYDSFANIGLDIGKSLVDSLSQGLSEGDFMSKIKEYISNIVVQAAVFTDELTGKMAEIGTAIAQAVAGGVGSADLSGLTGMLSALYQQASASASAAMSVVESAFSGYATGTDYATPGIHMVGEMGPEAMYIPQGAQISNAGETSRGMGGTTVVLSPTFNSPAVMDQREQMRALEAYNRQLAFEGVI